MGGLQVPCVQIGTTITLYQGDATVIAPRLLQPITALVSDPPYGIQFDYMHVRQGPKPLRPGPAHAPWKANVLGDDRPFDPGPWLTYNQIILWGGNHYATRLPDRPAWLVWDKRDGSASDNFGDCELAWTNLKGTSRFLSIKSRGMAQMAEMNLVHGGKLHPSQKPVDLMRWCVEETAGTVLDPYMGSSSTGVACLQLGRTFVGIELDPDYFAIACRRLQDEYDQVRLFALPAPRTA
jgi:site-specific DNA-methyltransferase (adenine-specific)